MVSRVDSHPPNTFPHSAHLLWCGFGDGLWVPTWHWRIDDTDLVGCPSTIWCRCWHTRTWLYALAGWQQHFDCAPPCAGHGWIKNDNNATHTLPLEHFWIFDRLPPHLTGFLFVFVELSLFHIHNARECASTVNWMLTFDLNKLCSACMLKNWVKKRFKEGSNKKCHIQRFGRGSKLDPPPLQTVKRDCFFWPHLPNRNTWHHQPYTNTRINPGQTSHIRIIFSQKSMKQNLKKKVSGTANATHEERTPLHQSARTVEPRSTFFFWGGGGHIFLSDLTPPLQPLNGLQRFALWPPPPTPKPSFMVRNIHASLKQLDDGNKKKHEERKKKTE